MTTEEVLTEILQEIEKKFAQADCNLCAEGLLTAALIVKAKLLKVSEVSQR